MNPYWPRQSGNSQGTLKALPDGIAIKRPLREESELVKLYRNITQEDESRARNVLMFVMGDEEKDEAGRPD